MQSHSPRTAEVGNVIENTGKRISCRLCRGQPLSCTERKRKPCAAVRVLVNVNFTTATPVSPIVFCSAAARNARPCGSDNKEAKSETAAGPAAEDGRARTVQRRAHVGAAAMQHAVAINADVCSARAKRSSRWR